MTATAIVVTHNSAGQIGESLAALCDSEASVRVVDNASTDRTDALIRRDHPDVWLESNPTNVGFARAVNQALRGTSADVVLLVNPDCVTPTETVRGLVSHLRGHPEVGVAGPRLVGAKGETAISAHPFETLASVVASRFGGSLLPPALRRHLGGRNRRRSINASLGGATAASGPVAVDWLSGACLAVRGDLLRELGGLDERYFLYYEDEELCLQVRRRGYEVVLLPQLQARHVGGASSQPGATWPHLYRSMLIFFGSHRRSSYQLLRLVVLVRAVLGLGLAQARRLLRRSSAERRSRAWREIAVMALAMSRPPEGGLACES
jgi:N-acetylglucosaminyl-diphospho-decaprenol L-rhamnosyltransferase